MATAELTADCLAKVQQNGLARPVSTPETLLAAAPFAAVDPACLAGDVKSDGGRQLTPNKTLGAQARELRAAAIHADEAAEGARVTAAMEFVHKRASQSGGRLALGITIPFDADFRVAEFGVNGKHRSKLDAWAKANELELGGGELGVDVRAAEEYAAEKATIAALALEQRRAEIASLELDFNAACAYVYRQLRANFIDTHTSVFVRFDSIFPSRLFGSDGMLRDEFQSWAIRRGLVATWGRSSRGVDFVTRTASGLSVPVFL